jgi:hypothetical protein
MPGLPVLIAAVVAILVGWFDWGSRSAATRTAGGEGLDEPDDLPEREGLP